jgi:hypothetical protein
LAGHPVEQSSKGTSVRRGVVPHTHRPPPCSWKSGSPSACVTVFSRLVETRSAAVGRFFGGALSHLRDSPSGKGKAVAPVRAPVSLPFPLPIPLIPLVLAGVRVDIHPLRHKHHPPPRHPTRSFPRPRPGQPSRSLPSTPATRMLSMKWLEEPTPPCGGPSRTFRSVLTRAGVCWASRAWVMRCCVCAYVRVHWDISGGTLWCLSAAIHAGANEAVAPRHRHRLYIAARGA